MGVAGNFWDLLKPYAHFEGADFLRDKRVAVDLSFWVVQHDAAIRGRSPRTRNPHLRVTFFRTLALFTKLGALPVFVVDGEASPLKSQARMERFFRGSGVELSVIGKPTEAKQRNRVFSAWVQECVELLEILGMPVLKAQSEAEALCAQLNNEGHVDACITSDSDAFLYGANCVIKCLRSNSKEPFECYYMSDIEAGLGLKRKQMVAMALLVGNDHHSRGVSGFGAETALRFVKLFSDDEVLDRLSEIGKGIIPTFQKGIEASFDQGCSKDQIVKEQRKQEIWQFKACQKIAAENDFPKKEIIEMYLLNVSNHGNEGNCRLQLKWDKPKVEILVDFLAIHLHWVPSYIRKRLFPMLSTIFLREMASTPEEGLLLYDQYKFHSIDRVKIRYGCPNYLVKWKKAVHYSSSITRRAFDEGLEADQIESTVDNDSVESVDDADVPTVLVDDGSWYLVTEENAELVQAAFPVAVEKFLQEKQLKESKSSKSKVDSESPKSSGVQLNITEFYRATKPVARVKNKRKNLHEEGSSQSGNVPADLDQEIPKSVRRRLLFE